MCVHVYKLLFKNVGSVFRYLNGFKSSYDQKYLEYYDLKQLFSIGLFCVKWTKSQKIPWL